MDRLLTVSSSPHIGTAESTRKIMLTVIIALLAPTAAALILYGTSALTSICVCVVASVLSEFLFNLATKKEQTIGDLSAVVTGMILSLNLHASVPIWQTAMGAVFAIVVVKCLFGGLGSNFANPAATARVFLTLSFTASVAGGVTPNIRGYSELVGGATPLERLANGIEMPPVSDMLLGLRAGALGEGCIIAILIGFVILVIRGVINFEIPIIFVGTVFVFSLIADNSFMSALYQILSGGLIFGSVFMATDYSSTPKNRNGRRLFAFGCGTLTFLIRRFGNYPEGVSFAILFMNIISPYIEKLTANVALGAIKNERK